MLITMLQLTLQLQIVTMYGGDVFSRHTTMAIQRGLNGPVLSQTFSLKRIQGGCVQGIKALM